MGWQRVPPPARRREKERKRKERKPTAPPAGPAAPQAAPARRSLAATKDWYQSLTAGEGGRPDNKPPNGFTTEILSMLPTGHGVARTTTRSMFGDVLGLHYTSDGGA